MANIKITELNGITKKANDDVLAIVDISANETKKIAVEDLLDKNVELIAVTDTEPAECSYGDKYYNTEDNLIYTAIANNTWSEDGEEPIEGIFYVVFGEQSSYAYNGTTLISVGGGTEDIIISPDEPTTDDWKLWIDSDEVGSQASEITNSYSTSTGLGYSANYVNNLNTYSTNEIRVGTWVDGRPLYRKCFNLENLTISATDTSYSTTLNIPDIDFGMIDTAHSYYLQPNFSITGNINLFPTAHPNAQSNITAWIRVQGTTCTLQVRKGSSTDFAINQILVTVEYTKTTD